MTVLDSRHEVPGDSSGSGALLSNDGVTVAPVPDLGAGRGPFWLDEWLDTHAADVIAWRRHIHHDGARRDVVA